jgi:hypothetical protein
MVAQKTMSVASDVFPKRNKTDLSDSMSSGITTRVIRTIEEIEEIRGTWESWQFHPNTDIDFFITNIKNDPKILYPHVVVAYRDGEPEALLAGRVVESRLDLKVGYASFLSPRVRTLAFAYAGFLGAESPENCVALVSQILESLKNGEADIAVLKGVRPGSPLFETALHVPGALVRDHFPATQLHRRMKMHESVQEFQQSLSGVDRREQKRRAKKLLQEFSNDVRIECLSRPADLDRMFRDVDEVARKTYQRGLGAGFVDTPNLRQLIKLWAERDRLRAYVLYAAGKPCAFWIGTLYGSTFHGDFMAFDPALGKCAPGMYLLMRTIEGLYADQQDCRVTDIDWGHGDAEYKEMLGNQSWEEATISIFAPTVRGVSLNALRSPVILFDRYARRVLERTRLLPRIKKAWRNRFAQGRF